MLSYEQYWGLTRLPFRNSADPEFFFRGEAHQSALLKLRYLVENQLGAGLLLGSPGCGKTLTAAMLAHELPEQFGPLIRIVFPQLSTAELLACLAVQLGADESTIGSNDRDVDRTLRQIEKQLAQQTELGQHTIILIDEAHFLTDARSLQALRLLLNFGESSGVSFTLLMAGDWQLASRIERFGSFDERLAVRSILHPLSRDETFAYVIHRLEAAGTRAEIFAEAALQTVFELSAGVPRRINRLCDLALFVGYADQQQEISAADIEAVAEELTFTSAA